MNELTPRQQSQVEQLFESLLEAPAENRESIMDAADCEPIVRAEVVSLLAVRPAADALLSAPIADSDALAAAFASLSPAPDTRASEPTQIGPYRILEKLGEGGMGAVYLAEQSEPLRRRVALKLIKLGMDTTAVIRRFEAERHALALMNHPNVARVLDAGVTAEGRSYFVMEHVAGEPITRYCDAHRLVTRDRIELFIDTCHAVQHAHQKGIIHRDIKPSNVLVTLQDGKPVPKVIDFGIAKAVDLRSTGQTMVTEQGQILGTPGYMSPEQAASSAPNVDTRTDIYSLGALLYEMLVGAGLFDHESLHRASIAEVQRILRDVEPPKPSTRVNSLGGTSTTVAETRQTPVRMLSKQLQGDLDWIVMKCLEKDRSRRYDTTNALALDLLRYLAHEPVSAGPPTVGYRVRKFSRRHRGLVAASSIILMVLAAGIVSTWTYARAESHQRQVAQSQADVARAINEFLNMMLASVDPRAEGAGVTVRHILDEASSRIETDLSTHPAVGQGVHSTLGRSYLALGLYESAQPHLRHALELAIELYGPEQPESTEAMQNLGSLLQAMGQYAEAEGLHRRALDIAITLHGEDTEQAATHMNDLAEVLYDWGKYDEGRPLYERAYDIRRNTIDERDLKLITSLNNLARDRYTGGDYAEAEKLQNESYRLMSALFGEAHVDTIGQLCNVAYIAMLRGNYDDAEAKFRMGLQRYRELHGGPHPDVARTLNNLGECVRRAGRHQDAATVHTEALAMRRETLGDEHPMVAKSLNNLALALTSLARYEEAVELHAEALEIRRLLGAEHPGVATTLNNWASVLTRLGDQEQALQFFQDALRIRKAAFGEAHPQVANTQMHMARCLHQLKRLTQAESMCRAALIVQSEKLGEQHPSTTETMKLLGNIVSDAGRHEEAEELLLRALNACQSRFGERSEQVISVIEDLIELYEAAQRTDEAMLYLSLLKAATQTDAD